MSPTWSPAPGTRPSASCGSCPPTRPDRVQIQELRRHDRFAGYVYTELADVEHEGAGLFDTDRRTKDWGGLDPAHENAETVLVVDLVPQHAGADIEVPQDELSIDLHVSHHGARELSGVVRAAWVDAGARFDAVTEHQVESALVQAVPFPLSETVQVVVPAPGGPARLMLWLVDDTGAIAACTFVDAAPIEPPNHRGARVAD